jgi:hypothetical protein
MIPKTIFNAARRSAAVLAVGCDFAGHRLSCFAFLVFEVAEPGEHHGHVVRIAKGYGILIFN